MRLVPPFAVCLTLGLTAAVTHAQTPPQVTLDYIAPAECPSKLAFHRALTERLPEGYSVRLGPATTASPATLGLRVRVNKGGSNYRAELTTLSQEGQSTPRLLQAPDCDELMEAMAFTAALTVDPNASLHVRNDSQRDKTAGASTPTDPSATDDPASPSASETAPPPVTEPTPSKPNAAANERPSKTPDVAAGEFESPSFGQLSSEERTPSVHHWSASVLAGVSLTSPISPGVSPAGYLGARYADDTQHGWSPAITVGGFVSPVVLGRAREARFSSLAAQVEFCPSAFRLASFTARPCAAAQLTFLRAEGEHLSNTSEISATIPNVSFFAEFQRRLASGWYMSAAVGSQLQLQQHLFEVGRPSREVAATRVFAPFISLRVGLSFGDAD